MHVHAAHRARPVTALGRAIFSMRRCGCNGVVNVTPRDIASPSRPCRLEA
jgi:hypothetical protein